MLNYATCTMLSVNTTGMCKIFCPTTFDPKWQTGVGSMSDWKGLKWQTYYHLFMTSVQADTQKAFFASSKCPEGNQLAALVTPTTALKKTTSIYSCSANHHHSTMC